MCLNYKGYKLISESNHLLIESNCFDGCDNVDSISYKFKVYKSNGTSIDSNWTFLNPSELRFISGKLKIFLKDLFLNLWYNLFSFKKEIYQKSLIF